MADGGNVWVLEARMEHKIVQENKDLGTSGRRVVENRQSSTEDSVYSNRTWCDYPDTLVCAKFVNVLRTTF